MPMRSLLVTLALSLLLAPPLFAQEPNGEALRHFETHVRPLLVGHCLGCHGPTRVEGGLRLDSAAAIAAGGDSGVLLVPGRADESLLIEAVERHGDLAMPPERPLESDEIAALRRWVDDGAAWPEGSDGRGADLTAEHWAFLPIANEPTPIDAGPSDALRPLDRFLDDARRPLGLPVVGPADRTALLRRLTYDLTGLPPERSDVAAFERDERPDAYERQVDRLLASAKFGEQWGRHWLDVARYADNKGYVFFEQQKYPWAWAYRDWVVQALDRDLPYDRFLLEQLAADRLTDDPDPARLAALGFLTVGGHFINNTHDIVDDRIDAVTRGLTGLTLACCRCHDHKYDPLTQADYYALYGIFASSYEPLVPPSLDRPGDPTSPTEYEQELQRRQEDLESFVAGKVAGLAESGRRRVDEYLLAVHERRHHPAAEEFMLIADPNDINPAMITRYEAYLREKTDERHPVWGPWHRFADRNEAAAEGEPLDPNDAERSGWSPGIVAALTRDEPTSVAALAAAYGRLFRAIDDRRRGAAADDATTANESSPEETSNDDLLSGLSDTELGLLEAELFGSGVPAVVPAQLDWGFLSLFPDRATQGEYDKRLKAVEAQLGSPEAPVRAMALLDRPEPVDSAIFLRGNPNRPGEIVPRSVPIPGAAERIPVANGSGRLELALGLIDPSHPLTDRVWVNRVWMHLFGDPLVSTPGDFGLRSDPPVQRRLLDHLTVRLRDGDRSTKRLIRELVSSAAYRRSSESSAAGEGIDPENRFWWRQNRKRLSFEAMRDTLLALGGRLSDRRGGPAEPGLEPFGNRRTIYAFVDRLDFAPLMARFDVPDPSATAVERTETTVPPQALFWLNHPEVLQLASETSAMARRELNASPPTDAEFDERRIEALAERIWQRQPSESERSACREFLKRERSGEPPTDEAATEAVWERLTHALLMSNGTIFVD